jgi:pyruvate carboxylase
MPGGQFTNLKEQARSLGLETRWHEVARAYHDVNMMFGDIVKVTPSSKVVGDMALMMVSQDMSVADVTNPDKDIAFPDSVVSMMRGDLGQPPSGWPEAIQKKVLKGEKPYHRGPGSLLPPADLDAMRKEIEEKLEREDLRVRIRLLSDVSEGLHRFRPGAGACTARLVAADAGLFLRAGAGQEVFAEIEKGKTLVIRCLAIGETDEKGMVTVFFELNGQPRRIKVPDRAHGATGAAARRKAEPATTPMSARRCRA